MPPFNSDPKGGFCLNASEVRCFGGWVSGSTPFDNPCPHRPAAVSFAFPAVAGPRSPARSADRVQCLPALCTPWILYWMCKSTDVEHWVKLREILFLKKFKINFAPIHYPYFNTLFVLKIWEAFFMLFYNGGFGVWVLQTHSKSPDGTLLESFFHIILLDNF